MTAILNMLRRRRRSGGKIAEPPTWDDFIPLSSDALITFDGDVFKMRD